MSDTTPRLWFLSPLETWGSFRVGVVVAVGLLLVNLGVAHVLAGAAPLRVPRPAILIPLLMGYHLAVAPAVLARVRRGVPELAGVDRLAARDQVLASLVGLAFALQLAVLSPMPVNAFRGLVEVESVFLWVLAAPLTFVFLRSLWRLRQHGRLTRVNLLEAQPLAALGRAAGLVALWAAGSLVISIPLAIVGRPGGTREALPGVLLTTLFLAAALYLPLSGGRRGIRRAKQAELRKIDADLGDHGDVLTRSDGPERVDHLIAYRERIEAVPEWPIGVRGAPRILLYVALPILSWVAAALVERWLDAVLE